MEEGVCGGGREGGRGGYTTRHHTLTAMPHSSSYFIYRHFVSFLHYDKIHWAIF